MDDQSDLWDVWPAGFRREDVGIGIVMPLGIFDHLPDDPQFAMLLAICRNTAVIATQLDRLNETIQRATDLLDRINDDTT